MASCLQRLYCRHRHLRKIDQDFRIESNVLGDEKYYCACLLFSVGVSETTTETNKASCTPSS